VAIVLVIALVVAGSNKSTGSTAPRGQIFLTAADSTGPNAFTPSVAKAFAVGAATTTTAPPSPSAPGAVSAVPGNTVGLYGGTLNLTTCNAQQMVRYLLANPGLGQAWAQAEGIPYSGLPSYIESLTPVLLRADTQVTNHSYANGVAIPEQSVLQAGTAVLIDNYGIPRARCYCGNPLTPAVAVPVAPTYVGPQWPTFSPTTIVVVEPSPAPLTTVIVIDTNTGQPFVRPVGTNGSADQPTVPTGSTTPPLPNVTGNGRLYSLILSNGQFSGSSGDGTIMKASDCENLLVTNGATRVNGTVVISGTVIAITFSNLVFVGLYNPSDGTFIASPTALPPVKGFTGTTVVKLTGTLSRRALTGGQLSETVTPPGGTCSYSVAGQRVLIP
jgi:hypothetical protein